MDHKALYYLGGQKKEIIPNGLFSAAEDNQSSKGVEISRKL